MTVEESVRTLALGRAARELELRRDEFRLAVQLGLVRTVPGAVAGEPGRPPGPRGAPRRVDRGEVDRLRAAPDFPAGLRERVRTVGTAEGAAILSVTPDRFGRLARTGHFSPVRFRLNRYRAVVWLYPAGELAEFALAHGALLRGRLPHGLRERLDAGEDLRPRNWRSRRLGLLLRATADPWERAAAIASLLDPLLLADAVSDPQERAHLHTLRPEPPPGRPESVAGREIVDRLVLAAEPDEILWYGMSLSLALDEARGVRAAPRTGHRAEPPRTPAQPPPAQPPPSRPAPSRPAPARRPSPAGVTRSPRGAASRGPAGRTATRRGVPERG
ncbi:DUF6397 family protein [Streptomyces sp. JL2001]|uniref:DUF6397 family protein n=1 Tax=Streptomyces sp. JL2001 TaxID=3342488 RepID=UPI003D804534